MPSRLSLRNKGALLKGGSFQRGTITLLVSLIAVGRAQGASQATSLPPLPESPPSSLPMDEEHEEPIGWLDQLRDEFDLRLAIDVSYRSIFSDVRDEFAGVGALGLDIYKVFSGDHGDFGTLILQPYLTRIDNLPAHPPAFEGDEDWELVNRITNFNYTGIGRGRTNFRIGHFEIPYGLEHVINTNGTIRDYTHGRNLGVKADWGAGINGQVEQIEYELTLSRGTGIEYFDRGDPFALAARIGNDRNESLAFGLSAFHGEVASPGAVGIWRSGFDSASTPPDVGQIIRRTRFGADLHYRGEYFDLLWEGSVGRDYDQDVVNMLGEIDWISPSESHLIYLQALTYHQEFDSGWVDDVSLALGRRFQTSTQMAVSVQLVQGLSNFANSERDTSFLAQLRYRF